MKWFWEILTQVVSVTTTIQISYHWFKQDLALPSWVFYCCLIAVANNALASINKMKKWATENAALSLGDEPK